MRDSTEGLRKLLLEAQRQQIEAAESEEALEAQLRETYGQLWDTKQLQEDYIVQGFLAPFVVVTRKSDNQRGVLMFTHLPRFYYGFEEMGG